MRLVLLSPIGQNQEKLCKAKHFPTISKCTQNEMNVRILLSLEIFTPRLPDHMSFTLDGICSGLGVTWTRCNLDQARELIKTTGHLGTLKCNKKILLVIRDKKDYIIPKVKKILIQIKQLPPPLLLSPQYMTIVGQIEIPHRAIRTQVARKTNSLLKDQPSLNKTGLSF